jgi:chromosome segregation ATPase
MESDQLLKRMTWLEEERRKDKDVYSLLENRIISLEGTINALTEQLKEQSGDITRLTAIVNRMDQFDKNLAQQRIETKQVLDIIEKDNKKREEEAGKVHRVEIKALETNINDVRKMVEPLARLEKGLMQRTEEENRIHRMIDEVNAKIESLRREEQEYTRTYRLLDDSRRQDSKRLVDLQGEVAAIRKRQDDQRGQAEILAANIRKLEARQTEYIALEAERRDAMSSFLDRQTMTQVERDRTWKDWQIRFDTITKQATDIEAKLLALDTTQREARRTQGIIEELAARVDRRINEITEIQRLAEDRFRQEWVTFKADDQKRWTNYTLSQEEQRGEYQRQFTKLQERATEVEDTLQRLRDVLDQANEETGKRLQALLAAAHEWATAFEKTVGRTSNL